MRLKLSWLVFTLLCAAFLTAINFNLFGFIYAQLDESLAVKLLFVGLCFGAFLLALSLLFVPYLTKILMIIFVLISSTSAYFMNAYGVLIDTDMIDNALKTDIKEVSELLNFYFFAFILIFAILPCFLIIKTHIVYHSLKRHLLVRICTIILALCLIAVLFVPQTKFLVPFFRTYNQAEYYFTPFYQLKSLFKYLKIKYKVKKELNIIASDAILENNQSKKLLVLVLGETARAENFSLGGYSINDTNAYSRANEKLVYFSDVSSCGTSTAASVPCMFSHLGREDFSKSDFNENALDILQKVGVKLSWLGNNYGGCQGVCDRLLHKNTNINAEFDEALLEKLDENLAQLSTQNLIILHIQGSHGPSYYKRYPNEFKKFTPTCDTNNLEECSLQQIRNTYDNTILYTDYLLDEIIKKINTLKGFQSAVLYVSDHGESLGENGIYLHSMPYAFAPRTQTHIPLLFYSNDEALLDIARKNKDFKYSHDNIFSTLLGYFGVKSSVYQPKFDILKQ